MAGRDDVRRVLAACENCESAYAARQWPDGEIKLIGTDECSCGSTDFVLVDAASEASSSVESNVD